MTSYTVHFNQVGDNNMIVVKEGFCWPAFFLSVVWAMSRRMWRVALGLLAVMLVSDFIMTSLGLDVAIQWIISLGLEVGLGFVANDLQRWTLDNNGWTMEGVVVAPDQETAERRFLENNPQLAARLS